MKKWYSWKIWIFAWSKNKRKKPIQDKQYQWVKVWGKFFVRESK